MINLLFGVEKTISGLLFRILLILLTITFIIKSSKKMTEKDTGSASLNIRNSFFMNTECIEKRFNFTCLLLFFL